MVTGLVAKAGLLGVAVAASALLSTAAPAHGAEHAPEPMGTRITNTPDVGTPDEVQPGVAAIPPDGGRMTGARHGAAARATTTAISVIEIQADAARMRAWVPSGPTIGLAYHLQYGEAGCQIPAAGYTWGWVNVNGTSGWMRSDLYMVVNGPLLPWC